MQRGQHIPHPVFLWTPSSTRGDIGATEKEVIKKRCSNPLLFCALPFVCVPLSMPLSLPHKLLDPISSVVQTTAGPHISDNPASYEELCSHIRTSEIKAAQRWTPPTSYLSGYYSQTDPCHLLRATCLASVVYWNFLRWHPLLAMSKFIAIIFFLDFVPCLLTIGSKNVCEWSEGLWTLNNAYLQSPCELKSNIWRQDIKGEENATSTPKKV